MLWIAIRKLPYFIMDSNAVKFVCPSCGCDDLQYLEGSKLSVSRAAVGFVVAGPLGALAGGATGNRRLKFVCRGCGDVFNHSFVKKVIEAVNSYSLVDLDFSIASHREFFKRYADELARFETPAGFLSTPESRYKHWVRISEMMESCEMPLRPRDPELLGITESIAEKVKEEKVKEMQEPSSMEALLGAAIVLIVIPFIYVANGGNEIVFYIGLALFVLFALLGAYVKLYEEKRNPKE